MFVPGNEIDDDDDEFLPFPVLVGEEIEFEVKVRG